MNENNANNSLAQVELQVSYCVCPKIQKESVFWRKANGNKGDTETIMQMEKC